MTNLQQKIAHERPLDDRGPLTLAQLRENAIDLEAAIDEATIDDDRDVDRLVELHAQYAATRRALTRVELHRVG